MPQTGNPANRVQNRQQRSIKPGLTKAEFAQQIQGHNLAEASLMARYQRAAEGKALLTAKLWDGARRASNPL
jgi:hypothetical protein